jgi:hypothetical protein
MESFKIICLFIVPLLELRDVRFGNSTEKLSVICHEYKVCEPRFWQLEVWLQLQRGVYNDGVVNSEID